MIAYFDASAFVKLVLEEPGSTDARDIYATAARAHSSRLLVPESQSAIARATSAGTFSPAGRARAFELLGALLDEVRPVELTADVAERAGELARSLRLRGSDAVHLASFEAIESATTVLVAADGDLVRAASSLGYAAAVPGRG